ncbi:hypothetical protein D3C75_1121740 [compost metagenome]
MLDGFTILELKLRINAPYSSNCNFRIVFILVGAAGNCCGLGIDAVSFIVRVRGFPLIIALAACEADGQHDA